MKQAPKYRDSTRRELSPGHRRRLALLIGTLVVLLVAIVVVAILVAFGEVTFR